jgi:F0F1-type ATP synthase membrane subunit b/b'
MESENELLLLGAAGLAAYFIFAKPLSTAAGGLAEGVADIGTSAGNLAENIGGNVGNVITEAKEQVIQTAETAQEIIQQAASDVKKINEKIIAPTISNTGEIIGNITGAAAEVSQNVFNVVDKIGDTAEKIIVNAPQMATNVYTQIDKALGGVLPGGSYNIVVPAVSKIAQKTVSNVANVIKETPKVVISTAKQSVNVAAQATAKVAQTITSSPIVKKFKNLFKW